MFYILMIIGLILIGASFFLWFQLNRESTEVSGGDTITSKEKIPKTPKPNKVFPKAKVEKKQKEKTKKGKKNVEESIDDEISWDNFEIVKRDKGSLEEQREMDEMFGFETRKDDGLLERAKQDSASQRKSKSIEEEFGDLFSDEEKQEITDVFEPTKNIKENQNKDFDDFSDFENFQLGDEDIEINESNKINESNEINESKNGLDGDTYDFLKNYDFNSNKEEVTDDIFARARNQKSEDNNNSKEKLENIDTEDDFSFIGDLDFNEKTPDKEKELVTPKKQDLLDDDDDIFSRLQRLNDMVGQQKK